MLWPLRSPQIPHPPLRIARSGKTGFSQLLNEWEVGQEVAWPLGGSQAGGLGALHHQSWRPVLSPPGGCMGHLLVLPVAAPSLAESSLRKGVGPAHLHVLFGPRKDSPVEYMSPGIQVYMENE